MKTGHRPKCWLDLAASRSPEKHSSRCAQGRICDAIDTYFGECIGILLRLTCSGATFLEVWQAGSLPDDGGMRVRSGQVRPCTCWR